VSSYGDGIGVQPSWRLQVREAERDDRRGGDKVKQGTLKNNKPIGGDGKWEEAGVEATFGG